VRRVRTQRLVLPLPPATRAAVVSATGALTAKIHGQAAAVCHVRTGVYVPAHRPEHTHVRVGLDTAEQPVRQ